MFRQSTTKLDSNILSSYRETVTRIGKDLVVKYSCQIEWNRNLTLNWQNLKASWIILSPAKLHQVHLKNSGTTSQPGFSYLNSCFCSPFCTELAESHTFFRGIVFLLTFTSWTLFWVWTVSQFEKQTLYPEENRFNATLGHTDLSKNISLVTVSIVRYIGYSMKYYFHKLTHYMAN